MPEIQCVFCDVRACTDEIDKTPEFCPRRYAIDGLKKADEIRNTNERVKKVADVAKSVETEGYRKWPRVRELIEFSKRMEFKKLGIAFCIGLKEETAQLVKILKSHDFEVSSVACTVEGGCNPVGQAMVLNHQETDMNIIMGLCMGHDVLFSKYSEAPITTLVVKDRAMCHNPAAPLVNRYWRDTFMKE